MQIRSVENQCKAKITDGSKEEEIVQFLHDSNITITESIRIFASLYKISLGDAKIIVSRHPCWKEIVENSGPLHDELIKHFTKKKSKE